MSETKSGGGGGLFKKLKGAIFEADPNAPETEPEPVAARPPARGVSPTVVSTVSAPSTVRSVPTGTSDPKIRAVLEKPVIEAAKPAYTAFLATMSNLKSVIPDEVTRIKAAIATLPAGTSLAQLIVDIDECLAAITKKEGEVSDAAQRKRTKDVGGLEQQLKDAIAGVAQKREQIAALQREISQNDAVESRLRAEISTASADIDNTLAATAATAAEMRQELTEVRSKIKQQAGG